MDDPSRDNSNDSGEWSADELIPFGKYVLLDRISGGATAAVYRANVRGEAGFERLVAVKRILPHMAGDRAFIDVFVREAKTVARMAHPGICPIYELGKVGESLYMAVEYIQGKDLGHILRRLNKQDVQMPPSIMAWITARLCEALDYAHAMKNARGESAGIIHRDLSPNNVLISYEGQVKLIDFGLAKAVGRAQATNVDALKQKLSYMSPEMVKGKPIDARSDIFGVGVCLYEMITGKRLFVGANEIETLRLVSRASVPPPSAVIEDPPDDLEMIVMRSLQREPQDRFQTAGEMASALDSYLHATDPDFGVQNVAEWMHALYGDELAEEQGRIKRLLAASADPVLIQERRAFFASSAGAIARARAELDRRLSTDLPPARDRLHPQVPKAARVPAEALVPPPPLGFEDEVTGFYDPEKTQAAPLDLAAQAFRGGDDEEKTVAGPLPAESAFDEEPTRMVEHGFEEEPTTVFFNKEEGIGLQAILQEGELLEQVAGLNRPILAPDLSPQEPDGPSSFPPSLAPPPFSDRAAPPPLPTGGALSRFTDIVTAEVNAGASLLRQPPGSLAVTVGVLLLLLAILGLIFRTPAGVALGLRSPSTGSLEIYSVPSSAEVKLDGVPRGRAPLRMQGVRTGTRRVEVRADGFLPVTKDVAIEGGETSQVKVELVAAQLLPGAAPNANSSAPNTSAPADPNSNAPAATTARPNPQSVPAQRSAQEPVAPMEQPDPAEPASGAGPAASGELSKGAAMGTLVVYTVPWSMVFIDGQDTGRTTPLVAYPVAPGRHELRLQTTAGQVHQEQIDVFAGQTLRVTRRF
jgi:eukaryotic-like serine/threonine-protein kinase